MSKFAHPDVLDGGLNAIKSSVTRILLVRNYTVGDSYATVVGNKLAEAVMVPADFLITSSGGVAPDRILTSAVKNGIATVVDAAGNHHFAFTNGVDKVLWVTDETGEVDVNLGDTVNFPALTYSSVQPV